MRRFSAMQLSSAADVLQKHEQAQEQAPLDGYLKAVAFFFSTLFIGIPVLLAYNYYVQRGARRKASEWIRWAAGGFFFFYLVPILLALIGGLLASRH